MKGVVFVKQAPIQVNNTSSLLDNENTSPASADPISNDFGSSNNNKSRIPDNPEDVSNSSAKSNNGTLSTGTTSPSDHRPLTNIEKMGFEPASCIHGLEIHDNIA